MLPAAAGRGFFDAAAMRLLPPGVDLGEGAPYSLARLARSTFPCNADRGRQLTRERRLLTHRSTIPPS